MPAGILLGGVAVDAIGLRATFFAIGCIYLISTTSMYWNRSLRGMDPNYEGNSNVAMAESPALK
jgi:hypothetical protein